MQSMYIFKVIFLLSLWHSVDGKCLSLLACSLANIANPLE